MVVALVVVVVVLVEEVLVEVEVEVDVLVDEVEVVVDVLVVEVVVSLVKWNNVIFLPVCPGCPASTFIRVAWAPMNSCNAFTSTKWDSPVT